MFIYENKLAKKCFNDSLTEGQSRIFLMLLNHSVTRVIVRH